MLLSNDTISFEEAVKIALQHEMIERDSLEVTSRKNPMYNRDPPVNVVKRNDQINYILEKQNLDPVWIHKCKFYYFLHKRQNCPGYNKQCKFCSKVGYNQICCQQQARQQNVPGYQTSQKQHHINQMSTDETDQVAANDI